MPTEFDSDPPAPNRSDQLTLQVLADWLLEEARELASAVRDAHSYETLGDEFCDVIGCCALIANKLHRRVSISEMALDWHRKQESRARSPLDYAQLNEFISELDSPVSD